MDRFAPRPRATPRPHRAAHGGQRSGGCALRLLTSIGMLVLGAPGPRDTAFPHIRTVSGEGTAARYESPPSSFAEGLSRRCDENPGCRQDICALPTFDNTFKSKNKEYFFHIRERYGRCIPLPLEPTSSELRRDGAAVTRRGCHRRAAALPRK